MKWTAIPLVLSMAIVGNVYASPVERATLLSHQESIAPNAKLVLHQVDASKQQKIKNHVLNIIKAQKDDLNDAVGAATKFDYVQVYKRGDKSYVKAAGSNDNFLYIFNNSSNDETYTVKHSICINRLETDDFSCSTYTDELFIPLLGAFFAADAIQDFEAVLPGSGEYIIDLSTRITNNSTGHVEFNSFDSHSFYIADVIIKK